MNTQPKPPIPTLEESIEVRATPAQVWALVGDVTHLPRWSPQVRKTFVKGGVTRTGATFVNLNRRGPLFWPTTAKVVECQRERRLAFRIKENYTVWSFSLEPLPDGGTRIIERREAPQGTSKFSDLAIKNALGGKQTFEAELVQGMRQTLVRLKDELDG